ncbi:MAG: ABC transporter permease, partial [Anaerolineales bacterium]
MKHTLQQVFQSPRFVIGFSIFMFIVLTVIIYPLFVTADPLEIIGEGTFFEPGVYVSVYDSIGSSPYTLKLDDAAAKRIASKLSDEERLAMQEWLVAYGIPENEIEIQDTEKLLDQWVNNYDPTEKIAGMTNAKRNYFIRLDKSLEGVLATEGVTIAAENSETDTLEEIDFVEQTDYVNINQVPNVRVLPLGTDNFGRDVLTELVSATGTSLKIGLVAGLVATTIGLILGLMAGYIGGVVDDVIMFITNIFTVIPTFVLLILVTFSVGQEYRGALTIAVLIGLTSWVWT